MRYMRLQYTGRKSSLHLTLPQLKGEYTFNTDNELTAPVEYDDAAYLLRTSMAIFKVVGGPFDAADPPTIKAQEVKSDTGPVVSGNQSEDNVPGILTGDGVEGEGPMPECAPESARENGKATVKKGKK